MAGASVLELGAGAALPSLVAALNGARRVVVTDYPDQSLLENIQCNVAHNVPEALMSAVTVRGFLWGSRTDAILECNDNAKFDIVVLADLIFNHSQHDALLRSCCEVLAPDGNVYVFFTHHRPWLAHKDLEFFEKATNTYGLAAEKILQVHVGVMFEQDKGSVQVRSMVHGWRISWK